MDLDKIKQEWQNSEEVKPNLTEIVISKMLDGKGQYALNSLLKYEKWGVIGLLVCLFLPFYFYNKALFVIFYFAIISIILVIPYQIFKFVFLKRCEENTNSLLEFSKKIVQYKKILSWEFKLSVIWLILFATIAINGLPTAGIGLISAVISGIIAFGVSLILVIILYKFMYWQNIKKLQQSIKEIKDFEKED